jgi:hypothetical protein
MHRQAKEAWAHTNTTLLHHFYTFSTRTIPQIIPTLNSSTAHTHGAQTKPQLPIDKSETFLVCVSLCETSGRVKSGLGRPNTYKTACSICPALNCYAHLNSARPSSTLSRGRTALRSFFFLPFTLLSPIPPASPLQHSVVRHVRS